MVNHGRKISKIMVLTYMVYRVVGGFYQGMLVFPYIMENHLKVN